MSNFSKQIILNKVQKYIEKEYLQLDNEEDFIDKIIDFCGSKLKEIGYAGLEWLKQKYMIGVYSRNIKNKFAAYNKATKEFKTITIEYVDLIKSGDYSKEVYSGYIKSCNRINSTLKTFKDVLPDLDYLHPTEAINNYNTVKDYMYLFTGRNGIIIK